MTAPGQGVTFLRARAGTGPALYASAAFDADLRGQDMFHPRCRIFQYVRANRGWASFDLDQYVLALCPAGQVGSPLEALVTLSVEGEVTFQDGASFRREQIAEAGVFNDRTGRRGRMVALSQIGGSLFAAGEGGQLYRRTEATGWQLPDPSLLDDREGYRRALDRRQAEAGNDVMKLLAPDPDSERFLALQRMKAFNAVNGPDENEVYVTGYDGGLAMWDGTRAAFLPGIPKANLFAILVEDPQTVWVCGSGGTLLRGNARDGFHDRSPGGNLSFNSMALLNGHLYLTANGGFGGEVGLFRFDGSTLDRVDTGLVPPPQDFNRVDAADGLLWAVGSKDVLCFDGHDWERIDVPGNAPIR